MFKQVRCLATTAKSIQRTHLINHPELWKGLPASTITQLYKERKINLGKAYKRSSDELTALLSTASDPVEARAIYHLYNANDADLMNTDDTDYYRYITQADHMSDKSEFYQFDEFNTKAQAIVEDFRDLMELNRKAAFELPQLIKNRQIYNPNKEELNGGVIFKFTQFLGESHPAERKVVMTINVNKLDLNDAEKHKLRLIAGARLNRNDEVVISCDKFAEPAQNKSWLQSVLSDLIKESKSDAKSLAEVPLDKRHLKPKAGKRGFIPFPKEWERPIKEEDRKVDFKGLVL
ncbi:mitochondrial 37S ribosomal protein [Martiniozyma asiatica (nom. inval.)]|nr:mitochondrial 37S ribosomal protein [Martiniozyma asiatica]